MSQSAVAEAEVEAETKAAAEAAPVPAFAGDSVQAPVKASVVPVTRALDGVARRRRSDQRWEVTQADLNMYTLITGRAPSEAERVAALTGISEEERKLREAGAGHGGTIGGMASRLMSRSRPDEDEADIAPGRNWSSAVLFAYLRDGVCYFSANLAQLRVTRPQVSAWVRHLSTEARRRLQETQARLASSATRTK